MPKTRKLAPQRYVVVIEEDNPYSPLPGYTAQTSHKDVERALKARVRWIRDAHPSWSGKVHVYDQIEATFLDHLGIPRDR